MNITTAGCETQLPDHTGREKPANPAAPEESPQGGSREEMQAPEPTYIHTTEPANGRRFLADFRRPADHCLRRRRSLRRHLRAGGRWTAIRHARTDAVDANRGNGTC